ncbi:MAG: DUF1893 domain-containing protein [Chloroflexi bacterium]|nr:DUF1893 domain-containing protein [Chloroflexota bacterium]
MNSHAYDAFLNSADTLRVYAGNRLVFSSGKKGILALLDYIDRSGAGSRGIVIMDRVTGNAAALLSVKAGCREVYSPLGSRLAVETLERYGIKYYLGAIISHVRKHGSEEMCPMEKLSIGKNPDEFFTAAVAVVNRQAKPS